MHEMDPTVFARLRALGARMGKTAATHRALDHVQTEPRPGAATPCYDRVVPPEEPLA
jgi:hypothetical protein